MRRDSSPFRGAEGWVEVCGVYALVYHDADTYVYHSPVRGGVLDAPWLRECRGGVGADSRRGRLRRRLMRRVRLCLLPNVCDFAGTARAPFFTGVRRRPSSQAGRAWKPSPTVRVVRCQQQTRVVRRPKAGRRGRRPLRVVCLLYVAAYNVRAQPARIRRKSGVRPPARGRAKRTGRRTGLFCCPAFSAGYVPRYAAWTASFLRSSSPVPERVMRPVSMT